MLNEETLETISVEEALHNLITFLKEISTSVILVAHNGFKFDFPMLLNELERSKLLTEFNTLIVRFADTLPVFRKALPDRVKSKLKFNQESLVSDFLGTENNVGAHNVIQDVKLLKQLINKIDVVAEWKKNVKTVDNIINGKAIQDQNTREIKNRKVDLSLLNDSISKKMINKLAEAGITLEILRKAISDNAKDGLRMLLGEDVGGKPRVI